MTEEQKNREMLIDFDMLIDEYQAAQNGGTFNQRMEARQKLKLAYSQALDKDKK